MSYLQGPIDPTLPYNLIHPTLPYNLNVVIGDKMVWSSNDMNTVNQHLGIAVDKVPGLCSLSLNGLVMSDKGIYVFDTGNAPTTAVPYDGHVKNLAVSARALCNIVPLGPNLGFITRVGGDDDQKARYVVALESVVCPLLTTSPQQLTANFTGKDMVQCNLQ